MRRVFGFAVLFAAGLPAAGRAQSFDCTKARSPAERAICAQPSLGALDRAVADAYAAALARPGADAAAVRAGQQTWLRGRDARCSPAARGSASLAACLAASLAQRLAALAPPASATPAQAAPDPSNGAAPPAQVAAPAPSLAAPPAPGQAGSPPSHAGVPPSSTPAAASPPAIPSGAQPQADAALDQAALPASAPGGTLLHVRTAGRFSLQAHSATGASLQLVDMMTGPADPVGEAGVKDGRADVLLDAGTYKLRVTPAEGAAGSVTLQALAFRDAAPPAAIPAPGETASATLADLQQRAYWLVAGPEGEVSIDAAGRALSDLRLWQGGDLVPLEPTLTQAEPVRGHPMTALRLSGKVEPGTYLLVAYGGPPAAWADGDAAMPFHLRSGALPRLAEGWASGTVGPLGSEVFTAPSRATLFRLDLPAPAPASLRVDGAVATIAQNSREPSAALRTAVNSRTVTVTGAAGQPYGLRAQEVASAASVWKPGRYWVSATMPGAGGEEVPPTALLVRHGDKEDGRILASTAPAVGPGTAWRTSFNVRGYTTLLLQNLASGEVSVRSASQGLGMLGAEPRTSVLPAGTFAYRMQPAPGRQGVADLVFGTAATGQAPGQAAAPRWPADPVVPFGVQTVGVRDRLDLVANAAPGLTPGLLARPAPVALAEGPLAVSQMPGVTLTIPVQVARGGTLAVADPAAGDLAVAFNPDADGAGDVVLPAPDHPRTVVLAWRAPVPPRAAIPAPPPQAQDASLDPATPRFTDLNDGASRSYDMQVPEGGLYKVETTGRLHTAAAVGTAFVPSLDQAEANGPGGNALLQRWLRAGRYRVRVTARDSAGHLGVRVAPAPLLDSPALLPGGTVRAALPAGAGLAIPVEVAEAGRYHLDLLGQGRTFTARLDDAEGWPLTVPGDLTDLERDLPAGRLRLLIAPEAVDVRVLARLRRVLAAPEYAGHGPHALVPEATAKATWREPAGRTDPRTPDAWTFTLRGLAEATLSLTDGMVADLRLDGVDRPVARLLGPTPFHGRLEAGSYRLEAASLGRNDRLDYALTLATAELQPGVPREVAPDAQVPFTLAEAGVVSLTSFGPLPVKAVLRDGAGRVIGRYGARDADWNIAVSRPLPAGSYRLDLAPAVPPGLSDVTTARLRPAGSSGDDTDTPGADEPDAQTTPRSTGGTGSADADASDATPSGDAAEADGPKVELTLALPAAHEPVPAPASAATLTGGGVHRLAVPQPGPGTLLLATAQSSTAVILAVERRNGAAWDTVALEEGTAPVVAVPADADAAPWRVSVWPVDGGSLPIQAAVTALDLPATALDALSARSVDGAATPVAVGRARGDSGAPVRLAAAQGAPLLAGGWPGHALAAPDSGVAVPQGDTLWVVARTAGALPAAAIQAEPGKAVAVPVPAGGTARLAGPAPAPGVTRVWLAESGLGQPGLDAGSGMGIAPGSALALGGGPVRVWNAGGGDVLRPRVTALDLATLPARSLDGPLSVLLPPRSALFLTLPDGERRTDLVLAPGTAAALGDAVAWTGGDAAARSLPGGGTGLVLLNTGAQPAPASVAWTPGPPGLALRPGTVVKRFFGAAGSFDMPVEAPPGARLMLAGDVEAAFLGADGRVVRGGVLAGPGRLTLTHPPGPLAAWLEVPGVPVWPVAEPRPQPVPAQVALSGPAIALALPADAPVLLHARTTAPVILTLGDAAPTLYPAGAVLSRYMAAAAVLRVDSPHDGPLSGTLELTADPVTPIAEGLGAPVALAPGDAAVFSFGLARAGDVGVGVRADPDRAAVRLLSADGALVGEGTAMLRHLAAGQYLLEARLPADAPAAVVRPAVAGIAPRPSGPPPDVAHSYLELVGLAPKDPAR